MVSVDDLRGIVILSYLTREMLQKLAPIVDLLMFDERETIFSENQSADRFYMLKRGKVLLEQRVSDKITVSVGSIKPGYSFGWSSMLEGERYTSDAVCAEPSEIFSVKSQKLLALFESDHSMGYRMTTRILHVLKKRMDYRKEQLFRIIRNHPDMQNLF